MNNAGINAIRPSVELSDEEWRAVLETDLDDARWLKNTLVWLGGDELRTGWRDAVLVELQPQPMAQ